MAGLPLPTILGLSSLVLGLGAGVASQVIFNGTGTPCKEKFCKKNFQTWFVVAGGGFLSYWDYQLIKFEEEKRFGL